MNLLDIHDEQLAKARRERDDAMKRVDDHTSDAWRFGARAVVRRLASERAEFTADDVMAVISDDPFISPAHDSRALGPVMQWAARNGIIRNSHRYAQSVRRHCTPIPVWESKIFSGNV